MEPRRIVQAAGIASVAWVAVHAVSLVQNSSGPAPEPTQLLLRLVAGPLVFLLLGNAVVWLIDRARTGGLEAMLPPDPLRLAMAERPVPAHRSALVRPKARGSINGKSRPGSAPSPRPR